MAQKGTAVTVIDADRNKPVSFWAEMDGCPENIRVIKMFPKRCFRNLDYR
jgi:hypothetical protein